MVLKIQLDCLRSLFPKDRKISLSPQKNELFFQDPTILNSKCTQLYPYSHVRTDMCECRVYIRAEWEPSGNFTPHSAFRNGTSSDFRRRESDASSCLSRISNAPRWAVTTTSRRRCFATRSAGPFRDSRNRTNTARPNIYVASTRCNVTPGRLVKTHSQTACVRACVCICEVVASSCIVSRASMGNSVVLPFIVPCVLPPNCRLLNITNWQVHFCQNSRRRIHQNHLPSVIMRR